MSHVIGVDPHQHVPRFGGDVSRFLCSVHMRTPILLRAVLATVLCNVVPLSAQQPQTSTPLKLNDVLARAVEQNPFVEAARARVRAAEGTRRLARTLSNPIFTYQLENTGFSGTTPRDGIDRETSIYATLPLEPIFQRAPRIRSAEAEVRASQADVSVARRDVALDAAKAFYRVALAQTTVDGTDDIHARLVELADYSRTRVKEGATSEGDLIRVEVELDRADAALALAKADLARARGDLAPYLGPSASAGDVRTLRVQIDGAADASLASRGAGSGEPLGSLDSYLKRARTDRPELVAARARVDAARGQAAYQRTLTVKQIGATLGTKRIANKNTLIAGLSIPVPILDQNRGAIDRTTAEATAVELEASWRERQIVAEVTAAHEAAALLIAQRTRLARSAIARAEESRTIALVAYREGVTTLLQVIDATRTLADIRLAYYRMLVEERQNVLELEIVSGAELTPSTRHPTSSDADTSNARARGGEGEHP